jgi:hypothetical protein
MRPFLYFVLLLYNKYNQVELIAASIAYEVNANITSNIKSSQLPGEGNDLAITVRIYRKLLSSHKPNQNPLP